jgi:hypothetical protein
MSAALVILPAVWATAAPSRVKKTLPEVVQQKKTAPELAFYRKYTEGMLRRYVRLSMEAGRAPSLLGREMFRGKVTSYRVHSFEDVVIADLSVLKSQMKQVLGIGQPGRLTQLEDRVEQHERSVQRMKGLLGAGGAVLAVFHLAIDYLRR